MGAGFASVWGGLKVRIRAARGLKSWWESPFPHSARRSGIAIQERPQDAAERILKLLWQRGAQALPLPVDPVRIGRHLGIDVLDAELPHDVSAALIKEEGEDARILLNKDDSRNRQRFSCAHEIGHFIRRQEDEYQYVDYRDIFSSEGTNPEEVWANAFAANLLMPEAEVRQFYGSGFPDYEMAVRFDVSRDAIGVRLTSLGLG